MVHCRGTLTLVPLYLIVTQSRKKSRQGDPVAGCLFLPDECFCDLGAREREKGSGEKEETQKEKS